jgi:hypothetical protein
VLGDKPRSIHTASRKRSMAANDGVSGISSPDLE